MFLENLHFQSKRALLTAALEASVPFAIHELLCANGGHITEHDIQQAKTYMDIIASKGDNILYSGQKKGETAEAFTALVRGLALLALCPGGVTFLGLHFEAKPRDRMEDREGENNDDATYDTTEDL